MFYARRVYMLVAVGMLAACGRHRATSDLPPRSEWLVPVGNQPWLPVRGPEQATPRHQPDGGDEPTPASGKLPHLHPGHQGTRHGDHLSLPEVLLAVPGGDGEHRDLEIVRGAGHEPPADAGDVGPEVLSQLGSAGVGECGCDVRAGLRLGGCQRDVAVAPPQRHKQDGERIKTKSLHWQEPTSREPPAATRSGTPGPGCSRIPPDVA